MNTTEQADPTGLEGWVRLQQRFLESFSGMKEIPGVAGPLMHQSVNMGEKMVDYALQTQLGAAHACAEAMHAVDTGNGAMDKAAAEFESMAQEWVRVRRAVWHGFFDGVRSMAGNASPGNPHA